MASHLGWLLSDGHLPIGDDAPPATGGVQEEGLQDAVERDVSDTLGTSLPSPPGGWGLTGAKPCQISESQCLQTFPHVETGTFLMKVLPASWNRGQREMCSPGDQAAFSFLEDSIIMGH